MKRYRIVKLNYDKRATILNLKINDSWDDKVKNQWIMNQDQIKQGLVQQYGISNYDMKLNNFLIAGDIPFSIIAFQLRGQVYC